MGKSIAEWDVEEYEGDSLAYISHHHGGNGDVDNYRRGTTSYLFLLKDDEGTYNIKRVECIPDPKYQDDWAAAEEVFYEEEYAKTYATLKEALEDYEELGEDFSYETGMIDDDEWKHHNFEKEISRLKKTL